MAALSAKKPSSGRPAPSPRTGRRDVGPQAGIVRVAYRRHGGETVEAAAQHDDQQPRIARAGNSTCSASGSRAPDWRRHSKKGAPADTACFVQLHDYLRWKSGDMISSSSPCSRASARATAWRVAGPRPSPTGRRQPARGSAPAIGLAGRHLGDAQPLAQRGAAPPTRYRPRASPPARAGARAAGRAERTAAAGPQA